MSFRLRITAFIEHTLVQNFIVALIVINAITLGFETSPAIMQGNEALFYAFDSFVLTIFVAEIVAKLVGRGFAFFKDGWNVFDFIIVGIALLPASGPLAVLRALRILHYLLTTTTYGLFYPSSPRALTVSAYVDAGYVNEPKQRCKVSD